MLGSSIERVLARGEFCHLAARTERGPHLTPMVFAFSAGSLWVTTARGSVKARAWRSEPAVGGLVADGDDAVSFVGRVRAYDLLDAETWPDVLLRSPLVTAASLRFSRKNARFFAGYAVDARQVPLAWTPPGRVFAEVELEATALLRGGALLERHGAWADDVDVGAPRGAFRSAATGDALAALPAHVRRALGDGGPGVLALDGGTAPVVLPARWAADERTLLASTPAGALELAAPGAAPAAALGIDRPSCWRARRMLGCMVQGTADVFAPAGVRTGARALASAIARTGGTGDRDALARLRPRRVVWWEGWTSGSANVA
jgi:hypothetical protein